VINHGRISTGNINSRCFTSVLALPNYGFAIPCVALSSFAVQIVAISKKLIANVEKFFLMMLPAYGLDIRKC
jgi:hypothetical protein